MGKSFLSPKELTGDQRPVVSFDFDGVLTFPIVVDYAKTLSRYGFRVIILTSRPHETMSQFQNNEDLYLVANQIGVHHRDIIFTNMNPKEDHLANSKVLFHLDDDYETIKQVNVVPGYTKGVRFTDDSFVVECDEILVSAIKLVPDFILLDMIKNLSGDVSEIALLIRNKFNQSNLFHGYTCCSFDGCNRNEQPNSGRLIATKDGWVCPCGKYKQKL